jgi:hypothetical protein
VDLLLCWFIAPVGLLATAVGLSLLVEKSTGFGLPWTIRPAMGLAAMAVVAQIGTTTSATARLTLPAILLLAVLGFALGRERMGGWPGWTEATVAVVVILLFASPFLVSGEATWAGYIKLDDTATWLGITDHVFTHGRGLGEMPPSTYQQVLTDYLGGAYPIGAFVPMALMSKISGQDIAFTFQPSMAVAAAMLALLLLELGRRVLRGSFLPALIAVAASLSALLLGYYLWGGAKELVAAALLPLGPLLAATAMRAGWPGRSWATIALTFAALLVVLGPGGALWALPVLVPALILLVRRRGMGAALGLAGGIAGLTLLLALFVIFTPTGPFNPLNGGITAESEIGNLMHPLSLLQVSGVWPSLDFRTGPEFELGVKILAALCLVLAAVATVWSARLEDGEGVPVVGYVAGGAVGAAFIVHYGSPWVDAKALTTLSPAILFAALLCIVLIAQRTEFRREALVSGAIVLGFVAWGAFRAYQGTWIAPRAQYDELQEIGERFAGQGPALSTESSIFGPRHFLRDLEPEGAGDRRRRPVYLRDSAEPADGAAVDLDSIRPDQLDPYNLLITRRGPGESRAPAYFELAYSTDHYDVWRRTGSAGTLRSHLSLGTELDAGAVPGCAAVARLATLAGAGGRLVAARVGTPIAIEFSAASNPPGWGTPSPYTIAPSGSGTSTASLTVPGGAYDVWLGGVVFGAVDVYIDGKKVASERGALDNPGGVDDIGTVDLAPGRHKLELEYHGASLYPGSALWAYGIGPLELSRPRSGEEGLVAVPPERYRSLCGKRWDWIEAYGA